MYFLDFEKLRLHFDINKIIKVFDLPKLNIIAKFKNSLNKGIWINAKSEMKTAFSIRAVAQTYL